MHIKHEKVGPSGMISYEHFVTYEANRDVHRFSADLVCNVKGGSDESNFSRITVIHDFIFCVLFLAVRRIPL